MVYILITILLVTSFFIIFRLFELFKVDAFQAILSNYFTCLILGAITSGGLNNQFFELSVHRPWFPIALGIGLLFLLTFFLISLTVRKVSTTVATLANRTSLVIPVFANIFIYPEKGSEFTLLNYIGLILAIIAIIFASVKQGSSKLKSKHFYLPLLIFLLGGIIDTTINVVNFTYSLEPGFELFPFMAFISASLGGSIILTYQVIRKRRQIFLKNIFAGILLGLPNFFSLYFLLLALNAQDNDGARVFTVTNIGIILLTSLIAFLAFKEKLSSLNLTGIALAILAILLIYL